MAQTTIHLVRHGHVENPDRVLYGRLPGFHLSVTGRAQAEALGRYFGDLPVAAVWSSPLERAAQTAAAIAAPHGLPVRTDQRLLETASVFEGAKGNIVWYILRRPRLWWHLRSMDGPSWGERHVEVAVRMQDAINEALEQVAGQHAVLVSHQAPIWTVRLAYEHRRLAHLPRSRRCGLASVTTLTFEDGTLRSISYAEPASDLLRAPEPRRTRT